MGMGKVVGIVEEKVAERYGPNAKNLNDMLGTFVRHGLSQDDANAEAVLLTLAGSDTTATVLRSTFLHLIANPPSLIKLHDEIDVAVACGKLSNPAKGTETRNLQYLQACIREGLRIWPPAVGLIEKEVPPGGDMFQGIFIPGGTHVGQSTFALTHDTEVFGDDADIFRPERWMEAQGDGLRKMLESSDWVFGGGRFECAGRKVALLELQKVFVEVGTTV